jgi:hypothetical protein
MQGILTLRINPASWSSYSCATARRWGWGWGVPEPEPGPDNPLAGAGAGANRQRMNFAASFALRTPCILRCGTYVYTDLHPE